MFRARRAHHQERQIVQPLVTVILCWWPRCVQVGRRLETCRDTHIENNLRLTLVIYKETVKKLL